jgi:hypothetical protein
MHLICAARDRCSFVPLVTVARIDSTEKRWKGDERKEKGIKHCYSRYIRLYAFRLRQCRRRTRPFRSRFLRPPRLSTPEPRVSHRLFPRHSTAAPTSRACTKERVDAHELKVEAQFRSERSDLRMGEMGGGVEEVLLGRRRGNWCRGGVEVVVVEERDGRVGVGAEVGGRRRVERKRGLKVGELGLSWNRPGSRGGGSGGGKVRARDRVTMSGGRGRRRVGIPPADETSKNFVRLSSPFPGLAHRE